MAPIKRLESQVMPVEEAGYVLGISRATTFRLARGDGLPVPVFRVGKRLFVSRAAVAELLEQRKAGASEPA